MKIVGRVVLILTLLLFWTAGRAEAHAYVDRSEPADGSEYIAAPPEIKVWFTEALETKFSTLTLVNASGQPVPGTQQTAPAGSVLVLQVPPLPNGVYTVKWHVLAVDTHVTEGTITFGVGVPIKAANSTTPAPSQPASAPTQPAPAPSAPAPTSPAPAPQPSAPAPAPATSSSAPTGTGSAPASSSAAASGSAGTGTSQPAANPTASAPAPGQSAAPQSAPTATDSAPAASTASGAGVSPWILAAVGLIAAASIVLWLRRKRS